MKIPMLLLLSRVFICGCCDHEGASESTDASGTKDPKQIPWLKAEIENGNYENSTILDAKIYKGRIGPQTVYFTELCCPVCDVMPPTPRNCAGEKVATLADVTKAVLIWRTNHGICE